MNRFACSWSGGKDSCYALMQAAAQGYIPAVLMNMMNENGMVSRSHAIPKEILEAQAQQLSLPVICKTSSWEAYEEIFIETLDELKATHAVTHVVFGDIDLQEHRDWEEKVCTAKGLQALLPLWKRNRKELVLEMLDKGIETHIVSCNERMGEKFLGQKLTPSLIIKLEKLGVDACGENGEYHTLVTNMPMFSKPLSVDFGVRIHHKNYWFIEIKSV
jgi:uncharacterized protein (TIGR00290 family)